MPAWNVGPARKIVLSRRSVSDQEWVAPLRSSTPSSGVKALHAAARSTGKMRKRARQIALPWITDQAAVSRLLKNAHLSRASRDFPNASPCEARGRLVAAYIQVLL